MDDAKVPVTAEWALWGKEPSDLEYRLLRTSEGAIGHREFEENITRYSPGALHDLPQVTVNGFSDRGHRTYLGLAVHSQPDHDCYDASGREFVTTSYYCVPFEELAAGVISYQVMYESFQGVRLQTIAQKPYRTKLAAARPSLSSELAIRVAARLLTGRPVCVLGADKADLSARLRFLDNVASLLPYGIRSQLSAATWVSSIFREHRLRLFFSSAPRDSNDHVVFWGQADRGPIGDDLADIYLTWLRADAADRPAQLALQTTEMGFSRQDVDEMMERLEIPRDLRAGLPSPRRGESGTPSSSPPEAIGSESPADGSSRTLNLLLDRWRSRGIEPGDWVSRALQKAVHRGLLVFNPPAEMKQGRKERVEVGIARSASLRDALAADLRGRGEPQFDEIETSSFMGVELKGDSFTITPFSVPEQVVEPLARWEFDVRPMQAGLQTLVLCVYLRIIFAQHTEIDAGRQSIPILERKIRIRVSVRYGTRHFLAGNWRWLIATAAGLGGTIAAWVALFH
jgi:hypothetical protein